MHPFFLKLAESVEAIVPNINHCHRHWQNSGSRPPGTFRAKKHPFSGLFFQICRIIDMYVFLVVFHGAELKNKCFNAWNCTVCPFSVGIEVFLGLNQGGGGMLDLALLQNSFLSDVDYISIFFYLVHTAGELRFSHFSKIFDFLLISLIWLCISGDHLVFGLF